MCEGRRLKKRKTSTKRNTLNPIYNEAIVFDVPPENIEQISLLIAVMDYDRLDLFMKKQTNKKKILHSTLHQSKFRKDVLWHESADSQLTAANQQHVHILEAGWRSDRMKPSLF